MRGSITSLSSSAKAVYKSFLFSTLIPTTVCHCFLHSLYLLICSSFHNTYKFISFRDSSYVFSVGICIGIPIFPHFDTQTHTYAGTNHTSSSHPILFALFHLCRSLSHTLSPSSLQLRLSLVRFRSLSLPLTVSLLSRAAESASSLCPNTDRLSNTNLRRKKIRRVCACVSRSGVSAQAFVLQHLRSPGADSAGKKKRNLFHTRVYLFEESRKKKVFSSSASFVRDGQ